MDPRHLTRIRTVQNLFALSFKNPKSKLPYKDDRTKKILKELDKIDLLIKRYAQKFPLEKIAKIDLAILRLSVYDLFFEKKIPPKVVINEAVELSKELGGDRSYAFINAILGKIYLNTDYEK